MKKGVALKFSDSGKININFSESVKGFESTIQNTIVNLTTSLNSDIFYPKKGTELRDRLLEGGMYITNAQHICNFAMADARLFINDNNIDDEFIADIALASAVNENQDSLNLKIHATSTEGNTSNLTWPL